MHFNPVNTANYKRWSRALILSGLVIILSSPVLADDYYWVGGSGNWSDINHWATASGGTVLHIQAPTVADDVIFDGNSFNAAQQTVTINQKNAICRDMTWTGVSNLPELAGNDTTSLRIYGSLEFSQGMTITYEGNVYLEATTPGKTISLAGHTLNCEIIAEGNGGGWELADDFMSLKSFTLIRGSFTTHGYLFEAADFIATTSENRSLVLSSTHFILSNWNVDAENLALEASDTYFEIDASMHNENGGRLIFNNASFTGMSGSLTADNNRVVFHNVDFAFGQASGDFTIDTLNFAGDGIIAGHDSITYLQFGGYGQVMQEAHVIGTMIAEDVCKVEGNHEIDSLLGKGDAVIDGTHNIRTAILKNRAFISNACNFDHLVVTRDAEITGHHTANEAFLNGNSLIAGHNTFNDLNLKAGRTYTFGSHGQTTINRELNASGTCYEPIRMLSDTNTVQSTIIKYNGAFQSEFLSLRDIKAEGSIPFVAGTSVDLGNNTNWEIETTGGIDLFWVNGQGNWNDPYHWDVSSGGPGGHCPPTEIDNAFFDGNSFSASGNMVNINIYNAVCRDMNWEDATNYPSQLTGPDTCNLRIYGSLYLTEEMDIGFPGQVFFEAVDSGQIVQSAENKFLSNVWFNGRGGFWRLVDDFETLSDCYFQQGGIKTLGNELACYRFFSQDTTTRYLDLSTSLVKLNGMLTDVWILCGRNLSFHADSSLLRATGIAARIISFSAPVHDPLVYHNVEFIEQASVLWNNNAYCVYNLVTFFSDDALTRGNCTIDTITVHGLNGKIFDSDTIRAAIFQSDLAKIIGGKHIIDIGYFYGSATVEGKNHIDTALFYDDAAIYDTNYIDTTIVYNKAHIEGANTFRTATLKGNGEFYGENIFDDLTLTKTRTYYFEHSRQQTIYQNLSLEGRCTGPIILQSTENTLQAEIHKVNGPVTGQYLSLRDIKATGVTPFIAQNSVDLGNNTGWEITTTDPIELYWVNGQGNWSDSLHWAGISGGGGGYCVPTPIDNVYFDENSFENFKDTVFIDFTNATCHNMDWTGAMDSAVLFGPDTNNLRVYGSLDLNAGMNNSFLGPWYFETTEPDHTIETHSIQFKNDIIFQGIGGEWTLLDELDYAPGIIFKHGSLDLNENNIYCGSFSSGFVYPRTLDISNAKVFLLRSNTNAWHLNNSSLDFFAGNSTIISNGNNGLVRTEGTGTAIYNDVTFKGETSRIYNVNTTVAFNNIQFMFSGEIHGNCNIDSVNFGGSGTIHDSDSINYALVNGSGNLDGGQHVVNEIFFNHDAIISGNNLIDTTYIAGAGTISGTNRIDKMLIIGGRAVISGENNFDAVVLMDNGEFDGTNHFRALKFSPGNIYEFEPVITQFVDEQLHIRGNNCFPITIRSQTEGTRAQISVPQEGMVTGDFLELRDMEATGGAIFYAGNFSTDLSNNTGWLFENAPGYIYGFAGDTTVCEADESLIDTRNFNPDENTTFLWHDGSTGDAYLVQPDDTMAWVRVNYGDDCTYTDTITIDRLPSPAVDLGDDLTVCEHDTIFPVSYSGAEEFRWQDGTTRPYTIAQQTGTYSLEVTNEFGCTYQDDIFVEMIPEPYVFLGNDTIVHPGAELMLDAGNQGVDYIWSTGDTTQTIKAMSGNTYWVAVGNMGCMAFDTIFIDEFPACALAVPNAFSPNGDGMNDMLYVRGSNFTEFELVIFNRWGEMIFRTTDSATGWDGTYKGKPQAPDAYNYYLKGICVDGQPTHSQGTITLLR